MDAERTITAKFVADLEDFKQEMEEAVADANAAKESAEEASGSASEASQNIADMGKATGEAGSDASNAAGGFTEFSKSTEEVVSSSKAMAEGVKESTKGIEEAGASIGSISDETAAASGAMDAYSKSSEEVAESSKQMSDAVEKSSTGFAQVGGAVEATGQDATVAAAGMAAVGSASEESAGKVEASGEAAKEAGGKVKEMNDGLGGSAFLWMQLAQAGLQFIQAMGKMDDAAKGSQEAFTYLTGDARLATLALGDLNSTAQAMVFGAQPIDNAAQHLMMMGKNADDAKKEVLLVSDAVAAMGGSAQNIQPAIDQLEKMNNETKITRSDIDNLTKDGVDGWTALAKGMSDAAGHTITVSQAQKLVNDGAVSGKQAYRDLMDGMNQYTGAAAEKTDTLSAQWNKLSQDAATAFAPLVKGATDFLHGLDDLINAVEKLHQWIDQLGGAANVIKDIASAFGPLGWILGGTGPGGPGLQQVAPQLTGYASGGTNLPSGWRMVGEDGPELQWSPGGDTILPTSTDPMSFFGGAGGGSSLAGVGASSALSSIGSLSIQIVPQPVTLQLDGMTVARQVIPYAAPVIRQQFGSRK